MRKINIWIRIQIDQLSTSFFSFLNFMAMWNQKGRPEFMSVAWTTEKSIQDELYRTSKAEILTMVISYLLMFAYIAIALGKIRMSFVSCFVSFAIVDSMKLRK